MRDLTHRRRLLLLFSLLLALGLIYALAYQASEPFYNNDETRHVMTGLYFRDLLHDMPVSHLRDYTIHYYLQYPALGLLVWPPFFYFIEGLRVSLSTRAPHARHHQGRNRGLNLRPLAASV